MSPRELLVLNRHGRRARDGIPRAARVGRILEAQRVGALPIPAYPRPADLLGRRVVSFSANRFQQHQQPFIGSFRTLLRAAEGPQVPLPLVGAVQGACCWRQALRPRRRSPCRWPGCWPRLPSRPRHDSLPPRSGGGSHPRSHPRTRGRRSGSSGPGPWPNAIVPVWPRSCSLRPPFVAYSKL